MAVFTTLDKERHVPVCGLGILHSCWLSLQSGILQSQTPWAVSAHSPAFGRQVLLLLHASEGRGMSVQLLNLLAEHALEPDVVLLAAPALASVLGAAQDVTLAALDRADGLAVLGTVVAQQAEAAVPVPTRVGNLFIYHSLEHPSLVISTPTFSLLAGASV